MVKPGSIFYPEGCECFNMTCRCVLLCIDWEAYGLELPLNQDEQQRVYVTIISPFVSFRFSKDEYIQDPGCSVIQFNISRHVEYVGDWEIYFFNDVHNPPVFIDYDIFRMGYK
jgi:hypothetical protein